MEKVVQSDMNDRIGVVASIVVIKFSQQRRMMKFTRNTNRLLW
jgi:hypothetical protein